MRWFCFCVCLSTLGCGYPTRPSEPSASSEGPAAAGSESVRSERPLGVEPTTNEPYRPTADALALGPEWDAGRNPTETPPDVEAPPTYATHTRSGLAWYQLRAGRGQLRPSSRSTVTVHYAGWTRDGALFDSSYSRGEPATFGLNQVIRGWTEGVQLMTEGEVRRFWIPADLAYGDSPRRGAPSGMLVFDVELISIDEL